MNELVIIVEGETEQTFVRDQLAAHLALHGTNAWAVLPGRRRRSGGVKHWETAQRDILYTLRERRYCSTMFDYYALPDDWPGRKKSRTLAWGKRAAHVEAEVEKAIRSAMGKTFDPKLFIAYVQLHEFEALAFAEVEELASAVAPVARRSAAALAQHFEQVLDEAGHPEAIDDSYEGCPSRRIARVVPAYKKRVYGPIVTERIGLDVLRERCSHFASWLSRLEAIGEETL